MHPRPRLFFYGIHNLLGDDFKISNFVGYGQV